MTVRRCLSTSFVGLILTSLLCSIAHAQSSNKFSQPDKFRQLEENLPTPNAFRTASGAPGHDYWQQRADYEIDVTLDDKQQRIIGREKITYHNNSPDTLSYVWIQLDNNIFQPESDANLTQTAPSLSRVEFDSMRSMMAHQVFDGSVKIESVTGADNKPLKHTIVKTNMRIDLAKPLASGEKVTFSVAWNYKINNSKLISGRTGYEYFKEDKNYLYEIAHWYPRMCAYTDATGWQHKTFLGRGEFTLEFGDFVVRITAPNDHVVAATGELQNAAAVLTEVQRERLKKAATAKTPQFVITPEEAKQNEKSKPSGEKTWIFKAKNVRDFAFASSRKFIWDAQGHDSNGNQVMAMSYYPNEGEPLWSKYSTHSIIHTMEVYSRYSFDYPYPVAISVNGPVYGMEYPMICFNGPRPEKDGTYTPRTKYGLISVVIHEVGHNYFPMIVNSDERRWTWMDEGINSFLQYLAEQEWEDEYPSRGGEPQRIVGYMSSSDQVPIMTHSDSIHQFGYNAYSKPAAALNVLRETVLGRELFDFAFREYSQRWKFKRPMPADFFRTMEDASGVDLDWFWRGWFYSTDHCDQSISGVRLYRINTKDPDIEKPIQKKKKDDEPETMSQQRNKDIPKRIEEFHELKDFYNAFDPLKATKADRESYDRFLKALDDKDRELLKNSSNFYVIDIENEGGLVMPVIIEITFTNNKTQEVRIPAEIWRRNNQSVSKLIITDKEIESIAIDPHLETADTNTSNNHFPRRIEESRFDLFKNRKSGNDMQKAGLGKKPQKADEKKDAKENPADKKELEKKAAEKKLAEKKAAEKKAAEKKQQEKKKAPVKREKQKAGK